MAKSAARTGSTGETDAVQTAASCTRPPSADSRLKANATAAAAKKPPTAIAVE